MAGTASSKIASENLCDYIKGQKKAIVAECSEQGEGQTEKRAQR